MCCMRSNEERVGVREMRQNLSKYLRRVATGETLEVTQRGRPVAILAPLAGPASPLDRLVTAGRTKLSEALLEERAARP